MAIAPPLPISAARVPTRIKLAHGLGSVAFGVKDNGFSVFLLIYYNQVLGINAGLVGTAIMAALIFDAFFDPLIGHWSDQTRSRWGRRLPWLYLAAIPLALAWLALWHPPAGASTAVQISWLIGTAIIVRSLVACCEVPSIAMVPEMTGDYDERTLLVRYRFLFGWGGGLMLLILAYAVFFARAPDGSGGVTDPNGYAAYALFGAILMAGATLLSARGQHRWVMAHANSAPPEHHGWRAIRATLSNRAFLILIAAALFGFINQGITFSLTNYLLGFVWQMSSGEMTAYALVLLGTIIIAFLLVGPAQARLGKRRAAIAAGAVALAVNTVLYLGYAAGWFTSAEGEPMVLVMFAALAISNTTGIMLMIYCASMMADVVEANQIETGRRAEGLFFAGYFFMQKCATGIGIFIAGQILSFAQFPDGAEPNAVATEVLQRIALAYPLVMLLLGIIGLTIMRLFPIDRASHQDRLNRLAQRTD